MINKHLKLLLFSALFLTNLKTYPSFSQAETPSDQNYQIIVNSNQDGDIIPDDKLTLKEAIAIINQTLNINQLSELEKKQITLVQSPQPSRIKFNLIAPETTIKLRNILPPIAKPVIIDGTTNPGYNATKYTISEKNIPTPVVAITPAENTEIFRGLTLIADNITVKGLSIYGFTIKNKTTLVTLPGDIVIAHNLNTEEFSQKLSNYEYIRKQRNDNNFQDILGTSYDLEKNKPTQNIIIENNWLGTSPNNDLPKINSAFGIYIFNSINTLIRENYITHHQGSAIITGVKAENTKIINNIITSNGIAGIPDAIRLEGIITSTEIDSNLICGNDGSSVYLFKPQGNVTITNNEIKLNGRRIRSSAIYLMGNNHQVINNQINYQTGPGVVIAAYPQSDRNLISHNQFSNLEGLSIDINTRRNTGIYESRIGDGINPKRNSRNRRRDTGNAAINAPRFLSNEFILKNNKVAIDGVADPHALITIYQVEETGSNHGPLNKYLTEVYADKKGRFAVDLVLESGDKISAIATIPEYGTSEPAQNAIVMSLDRQVNSKLKFVSSLPQCI